MDRNTRRHCRSRDSGDDRREKDDDQMRNRPKRRRTSVDETLSHPRRIHHPFHDRFNDNVNTKVSDTQTTQPKRLRWWTRRPPVPLSSEMAIIPTLMRHGRAERGMFRLESRERKGLLRKTCRRHGMEVAQALSLRRHHVVHCALLELAASNPKQTKMTKKDPNLLETLGLGRCQDIRASAALFEETVAGVLRKSRIAYHSEEAQKKHSARYNRQRKPGAPGMPTPDFLLKRPVIVDAGHEMNAFPPSFVAHWIEAKMFYAASSIPRDEDSAVGRLLETAEKYVRHYGPGMMVFSYGCGLDVGRALFSRGVLAVDAGPCDLTAVETHQRTWCADDDGCILP